MLSDRKLSALVAEKVMGWRPSPGKEWWFDPEGTLCTGHPSFATDSGLALEAAMKLDARLDCLSIEIIPNAAIGEGANGGRAELSWYEVDHWSRAEALGTTVARALCLAALRAVGVEVEDDSTELSARRSDRAMDERGEG